MNFEENRLRTFHSWPTNAPIDPERLARGGFFATGRFLETECHWCHKKISDWQYGDQIMARHRRLDPLCNFVLNPTDSENVPITSYSNSGNISQLTTSIEQQQQEVPGPASQQTSTTVPDQVVTATASNVDLKNEVHRLATFKNWPNPNISPQSLAKAGFYYLNQSDQVKCAWCKGIIAMWEKQDNAFEEHQRFFPDCPRVQLGPLIEIASDGIRDLGIQQICPPKKPKFSSLDARLRTYAHWPISDIQKPEALAQAGLYYQDIDDQVRCFHCNIGLRSWQKEDDPWFEHAKWFPHCQFVKLVKGPNYVAHVQEMSQQTAQANNVCEAINGGVGGEVPVAERSMTIDEAMCTAPVLQALEMGLNGGCIRNATQRQLECTGRPYDTIEDLVKAVLNDQVDEEEEEEAEGPEPRNSIVREVSRIINSIFGQTDGGNGVVGGREDDQLADEQMMSSSHVAVSDGAAATSAPVNRPNFAPPQTCSSPDRKMSLEEENRKLKDARLCKVCLDEEVGVVFLPCGHLVTCVQCAPGVTQCPLCRSAIKGFVRTYLS